MDGDLSPVIGHSQGAKKRSCRHFLVEGDVLEEPDSDFDESIYERLHEVDGTGGYKGDREQEQF